jgi:L-fuculose-phosphate aldolase
MSLVRDDIRPEDSEGIMFCPVIPVVIGEPGSQELADTVSDALCRSKLVVARGHGTFAVGKTLDEAYLYTSLAEHACRVLAIKQNFI